MGHSITIVGPGAVGATLAGSFAATGAEVSLLGREGPHLDALATNGLLLRRGEDSTRLRLRAEHDPARLPVPELVVVCVKSPDLPEAAERIQGWLDHGVDLLVVANGVPWWLPSITDAALGSGGDPVFHTVDPAGTLLRLLPATRVMAGVAHFASSVDAPGQVTHTRGDGLIIGDPLGGVSDRVRRCAEALNAGPIRPRISTDIRVDIWAKLLGNVNLNPVSALTGATVLQILDDPMARSICIDMFTEAQAVGAALGIATTMSADERLDVARALGDFRTSMLQDSDRGRRLELDAVLGAVRDLARRTGVPCPAIDSVYGLLALRENVRHPGAVVDVQIGAPDGHD